MKASLGTLMTTVTTLLMILRKNLLVNKQYIVTVVFHIPEAPHTIMLEVSPLVIQDGSMEFITTSAPSSTNAHGKT